MRVIHEQLGSSYFYEHASLHQEVGFSRKVEITSSKTRDVIRLSAIF